MIAASRAHMHCHVFHHTQHVHTHFIEHFNTFTCIGQGHFLGCSHHHTTRHRNTLCHSQLNIAGARRHIHLQIIHIAPSVSLRQLQHSSTCLRDAPHHGGFCLIHHKVNRHHFHAVGFMRNKVFSFIVSRTRALG